MPTYCFCCEKGHKKEVVCPMQEVGAIKHYCPECGRKMKRDYRAEQVHVGDKDYSQAIVSDSLAIMPSQREEHQQLHPDVKLDSECRPVFENYRQHDNYLEKTGFRKNRQRIRRRTKKPAK